MGVIAVRVCTHKFVFVIARMISLGVEFVENTAPYFICNDDRTFSKYIRIVAHHVFMRYSVTKSQHTSSVLSVMMLSIVSAQ
jgi:hypothetical protein